MYDCDIMQYKFPKLIEVFLFTVLSHKDFSYAHVSSHTESLTS